MTTFTFDKRSQRYRDNTTGRFVSIETLRGLVKSAIANRQAKSKLYTQDLFDKKITLREWENLMAADLKILSIQLYKLAKPNLTQADYGRIGGILRREYSRLRKLSNDIRLGTQSEAQILNRSSNFFKKVRELFEEGLRRGHTEVRARWERRLTDPSVKEHCKDCPNYEAMGWMPINSLPRPTERCDCRYNCKCKLEFSFSLMKPAKESMLVKNWGWL